MQSGLWFREIMLNRQIIIFDGVCNLCNGAVNFIIKRDPKGLFLFTPKQSDIAQKIIADHQVPEVSLDTLLLIKGNSCLVGSDAVLEIMKNLSGLWFIFRVFKRLPQPFRDLFYRVIARNRYLLFGRRETCMIPTKALSGRFIA